MAHVSHCLLLTVMFFISCMKHQVVVGAGEAFFFSVLFFWLLCFSSNSGGFVFIFCLLFSVGLTKVLGGQSVVESP